jgi:hypothetical protein
METKEITWTWEQSFDRNRHGSLYDRGSADSYYHRPPNPHWYPNGTSNPPLIDIEDLSKEQIVEYMKGYNETTDKKQWI